MTALLVMIGAALLTGCITALVVVRLPVLDPASPRAARPVARLVEIELRRHQRVAAFVRDRMNPRELTGLFLTVALAVITIFGVLAYQFRAGLGIVDLDRSIQRWADNHTDSFSNDVIGTVTDLGGVLVIVVIAMVVAIVEWRRSRSHWMLWFLVLVVAGQSLATNLAKAGIGRQRPELGMLAGLDPSFPSGHTAGAAATFAACALLLGRRRPRWVQACLNGIAVGLAVAVAASRVLLGVHWFSDVLGGLALGWVWFTLVALAFGGRLLRFGAPVEAAERHVELVEHARSRR